MKQKILLLSCLLFACIRPVPAQSELNPPLPDLAASLPYFDFYVDNIYYLHLSGDSVAVSCNNDIGNSYSGDVVIPETVEYDGTTYQVVAIAPYTFSYCDNINSITIPNTVYSVAHTVFYESTTPKSISFPPSVTYFAYYCFFDAIGLESISIAATALDSIGSNAFTYCTSLKSLYLNQTTPNSTFVASDFTGTTLSSVSLYVPISSASAYTGSPWNSFGSISQYYNLSVNSLATNGAGEYYATLYAGIPLSIPAGVAAGYVSAADNGVLTYTTVNDVVPANTAVLLTSASAGDYLFSEASTAPSAPSDNLLQGVSSQTTLSDAGTYYYTLSRAKNSGGTPVANSIGFYWYANDGHSVTCPANRAYLSLSSSLSAAREYLFMDGWKTTSIEEAVAADVRSDDGDGTVYDIHGRRHHGDIVKSGIYVVGGKKVFVK